MLRKEPGFVLEQAGRRCHLQLRRLAPLPPQRQTGVIRGMYTDTLDALAGLLRQAPQEAGRRLGSLCARHGLFVESLAELCLEPASRDAASELALPLLTTHCSLSALLEQASSLHDPRHQSDFVRPVSLQELCLSARDSAVSAAEHSEGWCSEIEVDVEEEKGGLSLVAIPSRVKFALVEVLKNAISSTMQRHRPALPNSHEAVARVPPVRLYLRRTAEVAIVGVEDEGVGVATEDLGSVGAFLHFSRLRTR